MLIQQENNNSFTFSKCTALRVIRNAGGSGALAKKSAIGQLIGANSFVCRHNSCRNENYHR